MNALRAVLHPLSSLAAGPLLLAAILVPVLPADAAAQDAGDTTQAEPRRPTYRVERAAEPVKVDAMLDEAAWQRPATFELAYETRPGENVPPPVRTEGWITYDERNLYVAFKAYDVEPQKVRARITDRDRAFQDDFVGVVLDTFNEERRAFEFFVNPLGVQMDLTQNEITGNEDDSWDALWHSSGRITEEGYVVEMAIPFSSLRFPRAAGTQTWGIDAVRIWPREQRVRIGLNPLARGSNCYLCQASKLEGFEGITPGRNLEFDPTVTATRTDARQGSPGGNLESGDPDYEPGLTARWGFTPNLTLNATLNPDFSQVEADVAQLDVNTQFSLFFPEKRPFFLEGADIFELRTNVIYTRNIADPSWGGKLTGKEGRHALGAIVSGDGVTNLLLPGSQSSDLAFLDEENTSAVLRYRHDLFGASTAGLAFTSREGDEYFNRLAGADVLFRWKGTDAARIELFGSSTEYPAAIVRDFGQPAGRLDDFALRAVYQRNTREWFGYVLYQEIGEDFRADMGFIPQVDFRRGELGTERYWYPDGSGWPRLAIGLFAREDHDHAGNRLVRNGEVYGWAEGPSQGFYRLTLGTGDRFFNGVSFEEDYVSFYGEVRPSAAVFFALDGRIGDQVDFANTRAGDGVFLAPSARFDLGKRLRLELDHSFQTLDVEGGRLFEANLSQLRATYQLNLRTLVRLVTQYLDVERNPDLFNFVVPPQDEHLFNPLLFSYKINPQTVIFAGYSDNYLAGANLGLTQSDRTLFLKLGYAWVL